MEVFSLLKFWRNTNGGSDDVDLSNPGSEEDEESTSLAVTGPQTHDFDKVVSKNKSTIFSTRSVGITRSFDNDINKHQVHKIYSKRDDRAKPSAFNGNAFSIHELIPPILILKSSPKNCVPMLGLRKSSSSDKPELNSTRSSMASPKIKESKRCNKKFSAEEVQKTEELSSSKYMKMIKPLYVKALKIKIFDQNSRVPGEKQGSGPVLFREVCKNLMKSKSSVRTVPAPAKQRDDSALQQQDGIQSAILYCKRSYSSASSTTISPECTVLSRSASESSYQNAAINPQIISR